MTDGYDIGEVKLNQYDAIVDGENTTKLEVTGNAQGVIDGSNRNRVDENPNSSHDLTLFAT